METCKTWPEAVVIAEIGCNHRGDVQTARELIVVAKTCGAAYAKFQKRNPRECLTPEKYASLYDNPHSYGRTYGEHREFLEFPASVHAELKAYAESNGIGYTTSVWDMTSAREIAALQPKLIKIPSACNTHLEMLRFLRDEYGGEVHLSVGMSTLEEIDASVDVFKSCPERVVLYSCTSGYPVPPSDVCLLEIPKLRERYAGRVAEIGFSGHHNGIAIDAAAYMLGARIIERHFTLDRTWKGTDHAASLEPQGLSKLVRDLRSIRQALATKSEEILPIEAVQRKKLKYAGPTS
ncbi:MAG: sialic acid synthase [Candidatus Sumerlaeota bacterium]|nr:sialic acid synthase [Candidatus Sumerlaeota bacterium]